MDNFFVIDEENVAIEVKKIINELNYLLEALNTAISQLDETVINGLKDEKITSNINRTIDTLQKKKEKLATEMEIIEETINSFFDEVEQNDNFVGPNAILYDINWILNNITFDFLD